MENKNNIKKSIIGDKYFSIFLFLVALVPSTVSIYIWGPGLVFYFDQVDGVTFIENIDEQQVVDGNYYNKFLDKKVYYSFQLEYDYYKLKKLKSKEEWDIIYSKHFPYLICIKGITNYPGLGEFILIFIFSLPALSILYFNIIKKLPLNI